MAPKIKAKSAPISTPKRITAESDLNRILEEPGWQPVSEAERRRIEKAARNTAEALRQRGGARPGAGRKPLGHVQATLQLKKETRAFLVKEAGGSRGMGAVIDRLVAQARGK